MSKSCWDIKSDDIARALRCALRQYRTQARLSWLALVDDLTGLCNRRAFLLLAREHMNLARRKKKALLLFYADLDNLKQINDQFGHQEGDRALRQAADIFRATFRKSDITARFGGDEFAALVREDAGYGAKAISGRLRKNMQELAAREHRYRLSLSVGMTRYVPESSESLEDLLARADHALYRHKRVARPAWRKGLLAFPVPAEQTAAAEAALVWP